MKKLFTILLLIFVSHSFAQISVLDQETQPIEKIGKNGSMGKIFIECTKQGDTYCFSYRDMKFTQIDDYKNFCFEDIDDAFDNLYTLIQNGLDDPPEEDVILDLPDCHLRLHFITMLGITNVQFQHLQKGSDVFGISPWLTKRKARKLFGKKN